MHDSDPGARIIALIADLRAKRPGIQIERRIRPSPKGWYAEVCAGYDNGAFPRWGYHHADRAQAMLRAVDYAHSYWMAMNHAR